MSESVEQYGVDENVPVDVFEFTDAREFLCAVLQEKKNRSASFSLRAWSRQLGFKTPSYLSAVLRGSRRLKPEFAAKVSKNLKLSGDAATRFELLTIRKEAKRNSHSDFYDRMLKTVGSSRFKSHLDLDRFQLISDWYHLVLLEMVSLADFRPDPDYLSRRLGKLVMPQLIGTALKRLIRLKLIRKAAGGRLVRIPRQISFGDSVPNEKIKSHHIQFLEKAKRALLELPLTERDFRGSTFVFNKKNIGKARMIIKEAHQQLRSLADDGTADAVFRFNSQLFCLTYGEEK